MQNGTIAIFDSEADYALKLSEYFNRKSGLNYSVSVFTDYDSFMGYFTNHFIDILLISEEFCSYLDHFRDIQNIFILTEGNMDSLFSEYDSLYKYQPTENILRDVMSCYASSAPVSCKVSAALSPADIIGVYSPVKRCGKTSFALSYGCIRSLSEDCLYLNLEEYSGFSYFTEEPFVGDLSDLLYFYRQNPANIDKKLVALSHTYHNLKYIPAMNFSYDIKNMETTDLTALISSISELGNYKAIILDISDSLKDVIGLLKICTKIYMPTTTDGISTNKIDEFFKSTGDICEEDLKKKAEILTLPYIDIHDFKESSTGTSSDFMEKLLFSPMGLLIKNKLTK